MLRSRVNESKSSSVQFLVSTMYGRFNLESSGIPPTSCLVINQLPAGVDQRAHEYAERLHKQGATVLSVEEKGLSRSRNRAIAAATADICVISDDDIAWLPEASSVICELFANHPNTDIITFQASRDNGKLLKKYAPRAFDHNHLSINKVTSFEIAFRRTPIVEKGISFDTRFGLGARYVSGEENIFLLDAIRRNLRAVYAPELLAVHPGETSGGRFDDPALLASKGALLRRMYGPWSLPLLLSFALKKSVQKRLPLVPMTTGMLRGWKQFGSGGDA